MENYFLLGVGYWNLMGSIALYLMLNQKLADKLLREWTWILAYPYDIGQYGSLWLLWAATTNTFFSIVNIFAVHWEQGSKTIVLYGDLLVYGIFLLAAIAVSRNEEYGKGHYVNIGLTIFWSVWAVYCLGSSL